MMNYVGALQRMPFAAGSGNVAPDDYAAFLKSLGGQAPGGITSLPPEQARIIAYMFGLGQPKKVK